MSSCCGQGETTLGGGCRKGSPEFKGRTLSDLVRHYKEHILPTHPGKKDIKLLPDDLRGDLFGSCFAAVLAMRWVGAQTMDPHQRNVRKEERETFGTRLGAKKYEIERCKDFHSVYNIVSAFKIDYIGYLTVYDTALRICLYRGMAPEHVYLHNGAFCGARYLLNKGFLKIKKIRDNTPYDLNVFPQELQKLAAWEIENFLCCCKQEIKSIAANA